MKLSSFGWRRAGVGPRFVAAVAVVVDAVGRFCHRLEDAWTGMLGGVVIRSL